PKALEALLAALGETAPDWVEPTRQVMLTGYQDARVPFEVRQPAHSGDIELGWPARKVGAYLDEQRHTAEYLENEGWTLFKLEGQADTHRLLSALEKEQACARASPSRPTIFPLT